MNSYEIHDIIRALPPRHAIHGRGCAVCAAYRLYDELLQCRADKATLVKVIAQQSNPATHPRAARGKARGR